MVSSTSSGVEGIFGVKLPQENVYYILSFLEPSDLCKLRFVNKGFRDVATNSTVQWFHNSSDRKLWRTLYDKSFGKHKKLADLNENWFKIYADRTELSRRPLYPNANDLSDCYVSWNILNDIHLRDRSSYNDKPITQEHREALFSVGDVTLFVKCRVASKTIQLEGPVTVFQLLEAMQQFYSTKLSDTEHEMLRSSYETEWNKTIFPTFEDFKRSVSTYAATKGDHVYYEGVYLRDGKYHVMFGS